MTDGSGPAPDDGMREEPLAGGNTHAAVVKVGAGVPVPGLEETEK